MKSKLNCVFTFFNWNHPMTTPMKSWQFSAWHSWHVMIVTRDLWRGSSDLRRDQCNGPRRPLTIPCHCLMGPATNFHQTCNTALYLYCICTSLIPLIIIMSRLTLPVAGSSCSLECSTWISLTPASREQNWNDYIKTSTFPINQPTAAHCSPASHGSSPPARVRCPPGSGCWSRCPGPSSWSMQNTF